MADQADPVRTCREHLEHFFACYWDEALRMRVLASLRSVVEAGVPLSGNPGGWAAGILYAMANEGRRACGVPGLLNSEVAAFFNVSMGTVRKRAAQVERLLPA